MCTFNLDNLLDMSDKTDGPPPAKRFKRDYTESITVPIGPEEKSFVVHKEAVCVGMPFHPARYLLRHKLIPSRITILQGCVL